MREISYVLRFLRERDGAPTVASGLQTVTSIGAGTELLETVREQLGGLASYESTVQINSAGTQFFENGTVAFGVLPAEHTLTFETLGCGYVLPDLTDAATGLTPGVVMWRIDSGTGFFDGARGLITSNFRVGLTSGQLIDDQTATILLP